MNRSTNKSNIIIYLLIFLTIGLNFIINKNLNIINPLMWFITFIAAYFLLYDVNGRNKKTKDKIQIIAIICIAYLIIYCVSGLIFGYTKSIYAHDFISIIKNIWIYIPVIIFKELVRNKLIKNSSNNILNFIFITLIFIISDISIINFTGYLSSTELMFKYCVQTIMPVIFANITFTYLASISNCMSSIIYRIILTLMKILLPVYPDLDWFLSGLFETILAVVTFYIIHYYQTVNVDRFINVRKRKEKGNLFVEIVSIGLLIVLVLFVGGFLKYKPIAVMSNSMVPVFKRGDVLIVNQIDEKDLKNLQIGYIIVYKNDNILVSHRIIKLDYDSETNEISIITKGDANNSEDNIEVTGDMIIGIVEKKIPYAGYPAVLFSELLN